MTRPEALLKILNNNEEPFQKRLKVADQAFKVSEFQFRHKEAVLLKWILNNKSQVSPEEFWSLVRSWLSSKEFKDLTQNDISNDDIFAIVELFRNKLLQNDIPVIEKQEIVDSILFLSDNRVFQHYFKYATELYCKLIALSLDIIEVPLKFINVVTKPFLFPKNLILQDNFSKHFIHILYPVLVKKALQFEAHLQVFQEIDQVIQKCIVHGNAQHFQSFLDRHLDAQNEESNDVVPLKPIFNYLSSVLQKDNATATMSFKLFLSAFSETFKSSQWTFKLLIFLTELLQFDLSMDFSIKVPFSLKTKVKLSKSLDVLLGILSVISTKNINDCTVSSITLIEFLRNILKSLIYNFNIHNSTVFEIVLTCILINPLVVEPIASQIIVFMIGSNKTTREIYEKVVIAIFGVFAKLHRVESFIAKIIPALKSVFTKNEPENKDSAILYGFKGEQDTEIEPEIKLCAEDIFTGSILECFTSCLNGLASWQVINVFKTMLYHFRNTVDEYTADDFSNDSKKLIFLELLGILINCLLRSVKIADHTVPQNVVMKFMKGLDELQDIIKNLGHAILKRQHNHITMRTFLNISYTWAEVYITLTYYSIDDEVKITTVTDKIYSATNLKYLHSYMDIKEWELIAQRITNFGEQPCKKFLHKLYIQKLRVGILLEKEFNEDAVTNVVRTLETYLDDTWEDLVLDKFTVNFILPKMDKKSLTFIAERLIEVGDLYEQNHIKDSVTLTNATVYVVMSRINRLFKVKRKHDAGQSENCSAKVFAICPEGVFFNKDNEDISEALERIMDLHETWENNTSSSTIASKEGKLLSCLRILKRVPFIYSHLNLQKVVLLYLVSLNSDILSCSEEVRRELEDLIIGTIQACKFPLTDIFRIRQFFTQQITNFDRHDVLYSLVVDNIFKHENSIMDLEPLVLYVVKNLQDSKHLSCSLLILQAVNKVKKSKMDPSTKEKLNWYKEKILTKLSKLVCNSDYVVEAYAICLKHYLSMETNSEALQKLLDKLGSYIEYSIDNVTEENRKGTVVLFTTVLQNKTKIKDIHSDIVLKIWNACKNTSISDDYSHLIKLIVTLIPNDKFELLVTDLFNITDKSIKDKYYLQLARQLKTWEAILSCDVNSTKMKIWQEILENLIYELLNILRNSNYNEDLYKSIVRLEQSIIQTQHFILSPPLIDMFITTPSVVMRHEDEHFELVFGLSVSTLDILLKHRHAIIMDRLPAFLQQYRLLLKSICNKSNSDDSNVPKIDPKKASNCVHNFEKLTKNLVTCKKDMGRIAVFLIADILERFEQINLYPNVKLHLNNCIYSLISLYDHHAVSYLMRTLSNASTEMFKIMYQHYKKYYMFTGKV